VDYKEVMRSKTLVKMRHYIDPEVVAPNSVKGITRKEFGKIASKFGLDQDKVFLDKVFWILDDDSNG
jgi:hypothetical protein